MRERSWPGPFRCRMHRVVVKCQDDGTSAPPSPGLLDRSCFCVSSTRSPTSSRNRSSGPSFGGPPAVISGFFENIIEKKFRKCAIAVASRNGNSNRSASTFQAETA